MIKFSEDIDQTVTAALPIAGLTAWQGLFGHGHLTTGQTVLIHGAAGGVGSIAVELARKVGAGTGRDTALSLGVDTFIDLQTEKLKDAGEVDGVFDVIGGDSSTARPRWSGSGARSSLSPCRPGSSPVTGGRSSSSSNPTAPGSPNSPRG